MINNLKKVFNAVISSALSAGFIFLSCAFSAAVPKGVTVNGVDIGGLPYEEAAAIVRQMTADALKEKKLVVHGAKNTYSFAYPEINFKDNLFKELKSAKRGRKIEYRAEYYLCGLDETVRAICESERVEKTEPYAVFSTFGEPFTYFEGNDGAEADKAALINDIKNSVSGGFNDVIVAYKPVLRTKSFESVFEETRKLASYTTYFDGDNLNRVSNVRLAASKINGTVLGAGEVFSFNERVGERTLSRGFLPAKIIENGEFTQGVGGGVCQVSTTLYNCALLSGLEIAEYHPHSLAVGYVPPSRDAMVSGSSCDLKIKNVLQKPVYIRAETGKSYVGFSFYGLGGGASYSVTSEVTGTLPAETEECASPENAREGKDGLTSQSYLLITRGNITKKVLLRKDKYLPVKGLIFTGGDIADGVEGENKND